MISQGGMHEDAVVFQDLDQDPVFYADEPFLIIAFHVPKAALGRGKEPAELRLNCSFDTPVRDPFVVVLGRCLQSMIECGHQPSQTLVDHLFLALRGHLLDAYGVVEAADFPQYTRGLQPWQYRRATELILNNLSSGISLQELARSCQLSQSTFVKAFKKTLGSSPHQWLLMKRIDRALELMIDRSLSLADIAQFVGFADQSHFTRVFVDKMGVSPGVWRSANAGQPLLAAG